MFALTVLMASCEKAEESVDPENPQGQQEIKLTAGITTMEVTSKAAVTGTSFADGTVIGLYAAQEVAADGNIWENTPAFANNKEVTISSGAITIAENTKLYYPVDNSKIKFFAFHPNAIATYTTGSTPTVKYDLTTLPDIMHAAGVSGTLSETVHSAVSLNFTHKLSKVAFKVKAGDGFPTTGTTVSKMEIKNVRTEVTLDIETGILTYTGATTGTITHENVNQAIGSDISDVICPTLLEPEKTYDLTVTVNNIPYTLTGLTTPKQGQAKNIVLTFTGTDMSATSSITDWDNTTPDENQNISKQ